MHRLAILLILSVTSVAACGSQETDPSPDLAAGVQYALDFGGGNIPTGDGEVAAGIGGWTSTFACAYRSDGSRVGALRFDDSRDAGWDLERDGGTPPPLTRSGAGVSLEVEHDGQATFTVSLEVGGTVYAGSAPDDAATVAFHHLSYATLPELLAIEQMPLTADDGSSLALTGTASFPMDCIGL